MSVLESSNTGINSLDLIRSVGKRIKSNLEQEKDRIYEEIRNYPRPIPACDQQFNYLLDQRRRIGDELVRMNEALDDSLSTRGSFELLCQFIRSTVYLDVKAKEELASDLRSGHVKSMP
jgi:hypothetical protein